MKRLSGFASAITLLLTVAGSAQAQIMWSSPTVTSNYTGNDSDIKTNGTFIAAVTEAVNYGKVGGTYPITVTDADTTFDLNSDSHITNIGGGGTDGSHSNATPYQAALNGVAYTFGGPLTFTLTGLNAADTYQVQLWNVDGSTTRTTTFSSTGANGTTSTSVYNGYVVGTFSGVTSQDISFAPALAGGAGEVNAVALRDLGVAPEPSTYAMMLGGLAVLGFCIRRKLARA